MVHLDHLFQRISEKGLNAKKLSEATGISTGNISDWKSGRSMPSAVNLDIIADYLDCSVDYLPRPHGYPRSEPVAETSEITKAGYLKSDSPPFLF